MVKEVDKIVVLDFGSQYNQLITRRIREMGIYSELLDHNISADQIRELNPKGIIFSGGPMSVYDDNAFSVDREIYEMGIPILGICYGMQLMVYNLGGSVMPGQDQEYGHANIEVLDENSALFKGLPKEQPVWMSHSDLVRELPAGFKGVAKSVNTPFVAMENKHKKLYGVQFHAEVRPTKYGMDILHHFAFDICQAQANWTMDDFITTQVEEIRAKVGSDKVLLGLSGGVDSSVVAMLLHRAIGDQLTCIFVDHGLLRQDEAKQVMDSLSGKFGLNVIKVDASKLFLEKLKDVTDPEQKRKIIGKEFIETFAKEAKKLHGIKYLAQGTLYTDVIESGTSNAQTIKSHHNVGGLPKDLNFELIEPLRKLFKDETRVLGEKLGLPHDLVWRQPFPGPGLAIRIMGAVTPEKLKIVRTSDAILREEVQKAGLVDQIWQYFTVMTGVKSVGVMGDGRTFDYTIAIRAINSIDGMTADFYRMDWDLIQKISNRIVNETPHVNRVVYDVTSKPPATIEWE